MGQLPRGGLVLVTDLGMRKWDAMRYEVHQFKSFNGMWDRNDPNWVDYDIPNVVLRALAHALGVTHVEVPAVDRIHVDIDKYFKDEQLTESGR